VCIGHCGENNKNFIVTTKRAKNHVAQKGLRLYSTGTMSSIIARWLARRSRDGLAVVVTRFPEYCKQRSVNACHKAASRYMQTFALMRGSLMQGQTDVTYSPG